MSDTGKHLIKAALAALCSAVALGAGVAAEPSPGGMDAEAMTEQTPSERPRASRLL